MKKYILRISIVIIIAASLAVIYILRQNNQPSMDILDSVGQELSKKIEDTLPEHPLSIEKMRNTEYPGSEIVIEQNLSDGSNYKRYLASYMSDGYKIYALLTVPVGQKPETGWPVIIFNHGYIPPAQYRTTERYVAYTDAFSRNGYIIFRPDYRGHGNSEGQPEGAYYSPAYTIDVLNAVSSIKKYSSADSKRMGMWGHSMGGNITLRSMVTKKDIKAGVIWAGVVASYKDMAENWHRSRPFTPSTEEQAVRRPNRQQIIDAFGTFDQNPEFWNSITPIAHINEISGPVQIHHGTADADVPVLFSEKLKDTLTDNNKNVEYYVYTGDDHNLSKNLSTALNRSVEFFDKHVKNLPSEGD